MFQKYYTHSSWWFFHSFLVFLAFLVFLLHEHIHHQHRRHRNFFFDKWKITSTPNEWMNEIIMREKRTLTEWSQKKLNLDTHTEAMVFMDMIDWNYSNWIKFEWNEMTNCLPDWLDFCYFNVSMFQSVILLFSSRFFLTIS